MDPIEPNKPLLNNSNPYPVITDDEAILPKIAEGLANGYPST